VLVLLAVLFLLLVHPIWQLFRGRLFRVGGLIADALLVLLLGVFVWPSTLEATPGKLVFRDGQPRVGNEQYLVSLTNKSDHYIYLAELDITISNPARDPRVYFDMDIPESSRKPIQGATGDPARYADTWGMLCHDRLMNPIFMLSVPQMAPHETREFYLIHTEASEATASIDSGYFTDDPQPVSLGEHGAGWNFRLDKHASGRCQMFGFLLDRSLQKGIRMFDMHSGGGQ
jgi:hypothetical protein